MANIDNSVFDEDEINALIDICDDFIQVLRSESDLPDEYLGAAAAEIARCAVAYLHAHQYDYTDAKAALTSAQVPPQANSGRSGCCEAVVRACPQ